MRAVPRALCLAAALLAPACAPTGPFVEEAPAPEDPERLMEEGAAFLKLGEPDQAYKRFVRALRLGGAPARAFTGAGLALEAQGYLGPARELLESARDLAPSAPTAHNNLGVVLYRLGEYQAARQAFRAAFAVSSGESAIALANMRAAERAIAADAPLPGKAPTHAVRYFGGGAYRILPLEEAERPIPPPWLPEDALEAGARAAALAEAEAPPEPEPTLPLPGGPE